NPPPVTPPPVTPPPVTPPPATPPPVSKIEAFRFLNQATFGATDAAATRLMASGNSGTAYAQWIDSQLSKPASLQLPAIRAAYAALPQPVTNIGQLHNDRVDLWFRASQTADDELRQRVAWALSQIMVVGQPALQDMPYAVADFYDMLARDAFANYRKLLEDVTLHPAMGVYLSMLGNRKPDVARNIRPDENYAREVMQLFSLGLVQLNLDGSTKTDTQGQPLPTYDQSVIEGMAHTFTGWRWAGANNFNAARRTLDNQVQPMQAYPEQHDTGAKKLPQYSGAVLLQIPARDPAQPAEDLRNALDSLFNHPNVGPFIAKQLIQRLVTSNPSPAYVQRVAQVFNSNSQGVRGDLGAVVRAILLDAEARSAPSTATAGKLQEPLLRVTQLWRAYDGKAASGRYVGVNPAFNLGQGPQQSPSVFNFYSPFYAPPGEISAQNQVAPELQLATEYQNTVVTNFVFTQAFARNNVSYTGTNADAILINIDAEVALADDPAILVTRIADKLLGGQISTVLRAEAQALATRVTLNGTTPEALRKQRAQRVSEALWLIASSPEYALQR
ncbi:MAG: DUF1800 domain-containing protein, partial [Pseudomonadales bacterium]|nr:DUF1800 domain-containing protein [Pseudomonadales bacterium]